MSSRPIFEFSAGGVVLKDGTVLLIRTTDLKGRSVWTFPKGQLQEGERSPDAALREVQEETGWRCCIEGELQKTEYWFQREGRRVKKVVRWFRMAPVEQVGVPDSEIAETDWVAVDEAIARLSYRSDRALLTQVRECESAGG